MVWNDIKVGLPPVEGKYLVYKLYPYQERYEVALAVFKSVSKIDYSTDNKQMMYKKFKFERAGKEPEIVKFWMFLPENPVIM